MSRATHRTAFFQTAGVLLCLGCGAASAASPETLYNFQKGTGTPNATLIQAADGNLYGTTLQGGDDGEGSVFRVSPGGTITTIVSFEDTNAFPAGSLVEGPDGNLYGVTSDGGTNG